MSEKAKGIGLFGLIGMVVSSCIGSGVFAITGQLAGVASPGAVLVAWVIVGIGFAALALSLNSPSSRASSSTLRKASARWPALSPAGATGCPHGSATSRSPR